MTSTTFPNGLTLTSTALTVPQIEDLFQITVMQMLGINPGTVTTANFAAQSADITVASIGLAQVGQLIQGLGIPAGTVVKAIAGNVITMSNEATFPGTYGTGGYGDMPYGAPSTWTAQVGIGSDANAFYKVRVGWQLNSQPGWKSYEDVVTVMAVVTDDPYNKIRDLLLAPNDETTVLETYNYTRAWEIRFSIYGPNSTDNARLIKSCVRLDVFRPTLAASNLYLVPNEADPVRLPENYNKQWWDRSDYRARYYEAVQETITQQSVDSAQVILEAAIGGFGNAGYGDNPYGNATTVSVDISA